jgi:hypothetical protein
VDLYHRQKKVDIHDNHFWLLGAGQGGLAGRQRDMEYRVATDPAAPALLQGRIHREIN